MSCPPSRQGGCLFSSLPAPLPDCGTDGGARPSGSQSRRVSAAARPFRLHGKGEPRPSRSRLASRRGTGKTVAAEPCPLGFCLPGSSPPCQLRGGEPRPRPVRRGDGPKAGCADVTYVHCVTNWSRLAFTPMRGQACGFPPSSLPEGGSCRHRRLVCEFWRVGSPWRPALTCSWGEPTPPWPARATDGQKPSRPRGDSRIRAR